MEDVEVMDVVSQMEHDRFFLKRDYGDEGHGWTEVSKEEFISAESDAGFHSKLGPGHLATAGFSKVWGETPHLRCIEGRTVSTRFTNPDAFQDDPDFRIAWIGHK